MRTHKAHVETERQHLQETCNGAPSLGYYTSDFETAHRAHANCKRSACRRAGEKGIGGLPHYESMIYCATTLSMAYIKILER